MRQFAGFTAATLAACLLSIASVHAEPQSASQQRCITKMNKAATKVLKIQALETRACLHKAADGLLSEVDALTCPRSDLRGRVAAARSKVDRTAEALCRPRPTLAYVNAAAFSDAMIEEEIAMAGSIFGANLALGAVPSSNYLGARCQSAILAAAERELATKLRDFAGCLRAGLQTFSITEDEHVADCALIAASTAAQVSDRFRAEVVDECAGNDLAEVLPGRCAGADGAFGMGDCLAAVVDCHMCEMTGAMHGFDLNCDSVDDGAINGSCGGSLITTTTTTTTLPPTATMCGNARDAAVAQEFDLFAEATTCTYSCLSGGNLPACVATCVSNATGLSLGCAQCYGTSSQCGLANCAGVCAISQASPACLSCLDTHCIPAFEECAAVPIEVTTTLDTTTTTLDTTTTTVVQPTTTTTTVTFPPSGYCTGAADMAVLASEDVDGATRTCTFSCLVEEDISACIASCVATATGLSPQCAGCFGDSAECGIMNCAGVCAADPNSASCLSCVAVNCGEAQAACMGTPTTTTTTVSTTTTTGGPTTTTSSTTTTTIPGGACTNSADRAVDELYDMQAQTTTCTLSCLSSPTRPQCISTCVASATGASAACSTCYGQTAECGLQNCAQQCAINQSSPPCLACLDAACVPAFDACTGLGDPPLPASCTNQTRDGNESDVDCGGDCDECAIGDTCGAASDCVTGECVGGTCSAPTTVISFGSCANGYIDPFSDPDALDLGAYGTGADDGYRVTLASTTDVYVQLTNQLGSTAVLQAAMLTTAGNAATAVLGTGEVVEGQNGTAGPTALAPGTYYLYVDSSLEDTYGPYDVCVLPAPSVSLGSCATMSVGNGDGDNVQLAGAGGDKGLRFTSPSSTNVIIKLRNLSGASTMAAGLYNGSTLVASSSTGTTPLFTERRTGLVAVSAGTPYTLQVDTAAVDSFGTFEVCVVQAGCGDGIVTGSETCDDGNQVGGDGCSAACGLESGKIVVDSCRTDNIPLFGSDCDDWTLPILENEGVYLEVTNPAGGTLLARGSIRQGSTQLVATGDVPIGQSGSTSIVNLSAGGSYVARVCDVTGAGTGNYTVCVRSARKVELGGCYAGNVTDGDGNAIHLAGPVSGGDEAVLFQPPHTATVKLTLNHKGGGGLLAAGVYDGQPGSLLAGSAVGASPSPIATGGSGQSGLFEVNVGQVYRVYTDIATLGTAGNNYEVCLAEVAGDACLNEADELVRSSVNLDAEAESSGVSCSGGASCISDHMESVGLSPACADCYGGTGSCAASNCAFQCLSDSSSSGCRSCVASNCAQEFEVCSGWTYED
ncbi:MAG TPA: hypothetical protein VEC57_07835 [Candidatus Limnocylindrales bacterium]|nr:hypothetical protein [Candidatus Limnocylindrales bacterium]